MQMTGPELIEIIDAVRKLGYNSEKGISVCGESERRAEVCVDDIRIGIYDLDRHTFVD